MIENTEQFEHARKALAHLEGALAALRSKLATSNPKMFEAMAESYVEAITSTRAEIDEFLGFRQLSDQSVPLWMTLEGESLARGDVSSQVLGEWLQRLRRAVHSVAVFLERGIAYSGGKPDLSLINATDLRIQALRSGSVKVGLRLPHTEIQRELFDESDHEPIQVAEEALFKLMKMSEWASSDNLDLPLKDFPDRDEAIVVAKAAKKLVPSATTKVQSVLFSGSVMPDGHKVRVLPNAGERLTGLQKMLSQEFPDVVRGVIREIDLDKRRVILRERGAGLVDLKCFLPDDLMIEAERMIDAEVVVKGTINSATPDVVRVTGIEQVKQSLE